MNDPFTQGTGQNSWEQDDGMGCIVMVLLAIALFVGGVVVGHWCL